jgi:hypothetical protein
MESLAKPLAQVGEVPKSLAPVSEELIDPFEDDGATDPLAPPTFDLLRLLVREHGENKAKVVRTGRTVKSPSGMG